MARTQAFDWFSTFLLAALILLVPILFVIWVNPGLLDRLQEEFVERPAPVGPRDGSAAPAAGDEKSGRNGDGMGPAPETSPGSDDDYISVPRAGQGASPLLADAGADAGEPRSAAKPVAEESGDAAVEASGVVADSPSSDRSEDAAAEAGVEATADDGKPAAALVDPALKNPSEAPLSTAPESLAVPPAIGPTTAADSDGDGDSGGLRAIEEPSTPGNPTPGLPTPASPPLAPIMPPGAEGDAAPANAGAPEASSTVPAPGPAAHAATTDRQEEILREIRSLVTAQRALEDQFSALREEIDGRLSVLKSAVDGVTANGSTSTGPGAVSPAIDASPDASPAAASSAEQARAERAAKILKGTLDGKMSLELGVGGGTKIDFVYVPPGRFRFGRTEAEDQAAVEGSLAAPAQDIVIDRGFFISRHEVSDEQFVAFLRANYADDPKVDAVIKARDDLDRPAANVSWALAKYFCLWASEESAFDVRLPTEIEWEYAAKGPYGSLRPDSSSADASAAAGDAVASSNQKARDVGEDPADRSWCGAVDFWGNVAEWCADIYDAEAYAVSEADGAKVYSPTPAPADWAAVEAAGRSVRGGSFADPVETRDLSERRQAKPAVSAATLGFRVVLIPDFDGKVEVGEAPSEQPAAESGGRQPSE